jgi:SAM-dependent methyltransferase
VSDAERIGQAQAFFAVRAAGWDVKFGDDLPAYAAAVADAGYAPGSAVVDIGCGTGRALPFLRDAVGPRGRVLGIEVTPEMLAEVRAAGRAEGVCLLLGDALHLPLADGVLGGVFAAGVVNHLPDPVAGLAELARVTRPGGRLVTFHPTGRVALAARHGRTVGPDEPLSRPRLTASLAAAGWGLDVYDDAPERFFAAAARV